MPTDNIKVVRKFITDSGISNFSKLQQFVRISKLVADIPWGEGRTIEEVLITKKTGTCTGKHAVLKACYDELGIVSRPVVCTFHWGDQLILYPHHLKNILTSGEWEHGHNYLQVKREDGTYLDVDVTFSQILKPYGFKVFPADWDGETSTPLAFDKIIRRWEGVDISSKKQELIASLNPDLKARRENFLAEFIKWVRIISN
ncbi:MAG: hypothetical protein WCT27_05100 [Patescibacteria group bacterium]|jgi:hypothetical protein